MLLVVKKLYRFSKGALRKSELVKKDPVLIKPPEDVGKAAKIVEAAFEQPPKRVPKTIQNITNLESIKPGDALKALDTSIETFFKNRELNVKNFNLLLQALSEKRDVEGAELAFEKMKIFNLKPTPATYAHMIAVCAKRRNASRSEYYFNLAEDRYGADAVIYNAMIHAYARMADSVNAEAMWNQTLRKGLKPDAAMLTSLVNAFIHSHKVQKAWVYFSKRKELGIEPDDVLLGIMVRACALDNSAEKAKLIFEDIKKLPNVRLTCLHYNALIKALASRKDYAEEAIEVYQTMKSSHIMMDYDTFANVIKAASKIGDIATAFNAVVQMNKLKISPKVHVFDSLIQTYATALAAPNLPTNLKELYLKDSWKLLDRFLETQSSHLKSKTLNSILKAHLNAGKIVEAEELVLPMFHRFQLPMNAETYEHLIEAASKKRDLMKTKKIYLSIKDNPSNLNSAILNSMLDCYVRLRDLDGIIEVLSTFKNMGKHPSRLFINRVAKMNNLPDSLYAMIRNFQYGEKRLEGRPRSYSYMGPGERYINEVVEKTASGI